MDVNRIALILYITLLLLIISRGALDPKKTVVHGDGLTIARAGEVSSFYIETRDEKGRVFKTEKKKISVTCVSPEYATADFCEKNPKITTISESVYLVEYVVGRFWAKELDPFEEGIYPNPYPEDFFSRTTDRVLVKIDNIRAPGSPFYPLLLGEEKMDPRTSLITGLKSFAWAGYEEEIGQLKQIRDRYGNNIRVTSTVDEVTGSLTLLNRAYPLDQSLDATATVVDAWMFTNWYISFKTICNVAGRYRFEVFFSRNGSPPLHMPLETGDGPLRTEHDIYCSPYEIYTVELVLMSGADLGQEIRVAAQAKDHVGNAAFFGPSMIDNRLSDATDQIVEDIEIRVTEASCDCQNYSPAEFDLDSVMPGRLLIRFATDKPGSYRVQVLYKRTDYVKSVFLIDIHDPDGASQGGIDNRRSLLRISAVGNEANQSEDDESWLTNNATMLIVVSIGAALLIGAYFWFSAEPKKEEDENSDDENEFHAGHDNFQKR